MIGKIFRNIGVAILMAIIISLVVIYIEASIIKNNDADYYRNSHDRITVTMMEKADKIYGSDGSDLSDTEEGKRKAALSFTDGEFTDAEKQVRCFYTRFMSGLNSSEVYSLGQDTKALHDLRLLLDENGESVMTDDTLILVRTAKSGDTTGEIYYTFQDDGLSNQMHAIVERKKNSIGDIVFHAKGAYLKGDEFVPEEVDYYNVATNSGPDYLYQLDKTKEEMEADGYTYYEVEETFARGGLDHGDDFFVFYSAPDKETMDRISELMKPVIEDDYQNGEGYFETNNKGPLRVEIFTVSKYDSPYTDKEYYLVSYENNNVLYETSVTGNFGPGVLPYFIFFAIEMCALCLIAIVIASLINLKYVKHA